MITHYLMTRECEQQVNPNTPLTHAQSLFSILNNCQYATLLGKEVN